MAQNRRTASLLMASIVVAMSATGVAAAAGAPQAERRDGEVTYTSAAAGGEAMLAASADGIRVEKRSTSAQGRIVVSDGRDRVTVTFSARAVGVERNGRVARLEAHRLSKAAFADVRAVLAGSSAVARTVGLKAAMEAGREAPPAPLVSALAFVQLLAGDGRSMRRIAAATPAPGGIRFARDVGAHCWAEYTQTVDQYWADREACIELNPWNPVMIYACNFEWTIKVELAWFSLIACSGGLPV